MGKKNVIGIIEYEIYLTVLFRNKDVEKYYKYDLFFKKKKVTVVVYLSFCEVLPGNPVMREVCSAAVS